jgi:hypothetical protein
MKGISDNTWIKYHQSRYLTILNVEYPAKSTAWCPPKKMNDTEPVSCSGTSGHWRSHIPVQYTFRELNVASKHPFKMEVLMGKHL